MSGCINKVCLIGRVGQNPEFRTTKDGKELATFSLATSETWKSKSTGDKQTKTEWHRIVVFSQGLVGVVKEYIKQGARLYIEGSLVTNKWTGTDNIERSSTEVVLQGFNSSLIMLDDKGSGGTNFVSDKKEPVPESEQHLREENAKFERAPELEELDDEVPF